MTMTVEVFSRREKNVFSIFFYVLTTEAATGHVLQEKVFLINSHYLQENTCVGDSNTRVFL